MYAANTSLYLRSMSGFDAQLIQGTTHQASVTDPVFSPDGGWLVFYAPENAAIEKVAGVGWPAWWTILQRRPGFWYVVGTDDGIVFGQGRKGIMRVSPDGKGPDPDCRAVKDGEEADGPQIATGRATSPLHGSDRQRSRQVGPSANRSSGAQGRRAAQDRRRGGDGRAVTLLRGHRRSTGSTGRSTHACRSICSSWRPLARRPAVVEDVRWADARTTGGYHYSTSETGSSDLHSCRSREFDPVRPTTWCGRIDRARWSGSNVPPFRYRSPPRVSPDGKRVAFGTDDGRQAIIYTYELSGASPMQREPVSPVTAAPRHGRPTGGWCISRIARVTPASGSRRAAVRRSASRAPPRASHILPESWSAKAGVLLFTITKGADVSLWTIAPPWKDPQPFADVHSIYPIGARFSPDGRWIAYTVREPSATGTVVYVRPFPATATRYPLPGRGPNFNAHKPAWSTDGTELFYVPRIGEFEVMPIMTMPTFEFGNPVVVPRPFAPGGPNALPLFDVAPDGRFIGLVPQGQSEAFTRQPSRIRVVLNWFDELRAAVPVSR